MGHFIVIINWDKSPINASKLDAIYQSFQQKQMLHPQPYIAFIFAGTAHVTMSNNSITIFNGYLDDFASHGKNLAEIALQTYKQSGNTFAQNLVGHFACVIWDDDQQKLIAVRDVLGVKRLYYHHTPKTTIVSNDFYQIQQIADTSLTLNEKIIKAHLQGDGRFWLTESIYTEINPIPPRYTTTFTDDTQEQIAYTDWHVPPHSHQDKDTYIQEFKDTYWDMLRRYTSHTSHLGMMVSGGLDSSGLAAMLYAIHDTVDTDIQLFSTVTDRFKTADEQEYLTVLAEACHKWALHTHNLDDMDYSLPVTVQGELASPFSVMMLKARIAFAKEHSVDTLIYGTGGDMVMLQNVASKTSLWMALPPMQQLQEAQYFMRNAGGLVPFSKQIARHFIKRKYTVPSVDYVRNPIILPTDKNLASYNALQQTILKPLLGQYTHALAMLDMLAEENNITLRLPYLDEKLIRFMMSVPVSQHIYKGWGRVLQRRAMRGILPEKIRRRWTKAVADEMLTRYLSRENLLGLADNSRLVAYGWVDKHKLTEAINAFHNGKTYLLLDLMRFDEIERWLQQHD